MSRNAMNQCIEDVNAAEEERTRHKQEWAAELAARHAERKSAEPMRECNGCGWKGPLSETCMLGSVGPLCPECRETTEAI